MYALMYVCALLRTNVKSYIYIYATPLYIAKRTDQRYGAKVWNGSKQVWNGGMERGYGTGVVPDLVPDRII